jgi:hypothetical protein
LSKDLSRTISLHKNTDTITQMCTVVEAYILQIRFALHVNIQKTKTIIEMFFDNRICCALEQAGSQKLDNNIFRIK